MGSIKDQRSIEKSHAKIIQQSLSAILQETASLRGPTSTMTVDEGDE